MQCKVGDAVFVRSNTRDDYLGRIKSLDGPFTVTLDTCSWVADSGRFGEFMARGQSEGMELEYIGDGWSVNWSCIKPWPHRLPTKSLPTESI